MPVSMGYINVTEDNANMTYIGSGVENLWGNQYTLCTCDRLEMEDSNGKQECCIHYVGFHEGPGEHTYKQTQ